MLTCQLSNFTIWGVKNTFFYLFDAHFFIKNPQAGSSLLKLKKLRSQKVRRRMTISNNNLPFN